ncbi:MAG: serine/threonine protein kinase, partial [Phycisphaerae bacterium]|nr:serine/threonine protein kinase [Phycisphaerae bacterium]
MAEVRETKLAGQLSRLVSAGADEGGDTRDGRIGAILNDFLDRRGRGEHVAADDVLARHPDLADELREHLATLREIEPPGEQIARLIDQGLLNPSSDRAYLAELGQYKILSYVGRGGMGIVLKAYEPALRRTVALKLLRPELVTDATALRRFEREAQAAAKLQHPNIVAIHAVVLDGRSPYIVMEYVAGRSLADLIRKRGPLDADTARHIFRQLLLALGAAHAAGLIHRDVKAANILLQETATEKPPDCAPSSLHRPGASSPLVKLADFGLAR